MFKIFALIFIGVASGDPAGVLKSKVSYDTKAACELALEADDDVKEANAALEAKFAAMGAMRGIQFAHKYECREDKKKDDGSI